MEVQGEHAGSEVDQRVLSSPEVGVIMVPKEVYILISGIWEYVMLHWQGAMKFADGIEVVYQLILR